MKTVSPQTKTLTKHSYLIPDQLKFVDFFAGIGGFRIGLENAGYKCVYSCEINPACQEVYYQNFGEFPDSDITQTKLENIPQFEILTAGFPCQPFSICGKRRGFEDTRGTLFFHVCELIEHQQPEVIVLENVKYLLHQDQGKTLNVILYSLEDLGYIVAYKLLNAKDFGVPQNRERVVIIATKSKKFDFDKLNTNSNYTPLRNYLSDSDRFEYLNPEDYILIETPKQQRSGLMFVGYRSNKSIWKKGVRPNTEHLSRVHRQPNRIYSIDGLHPTLPSQETSGRFFIYIPEENAVRKLTIEECYKIMGFPETFKRHYNLGESYKQIGNSVCVPMVYELGLQIKEQIFDQDQDLSPNNNHHQYKTETSPLQLAIPGLCMNHKEKLLQVYNNSDSIEDVSSQVTTDYQNYIEIIANNSFKQKGVYTVLITLLVHKLIDPKQDIRYHQTQMKGGFSGRTIDTQYITPTLKELGLPAMAESGWLTRSLEQPYPYTLDYNGKISNLKVKEAFLNLIDLIQKNPNQTEAILQILLYKTNLVKDQNKIAITKLEKGEKLDIKTIIHCLDQHFHFNYKTAGASKLPVLAFYAISKLLITEIERYQKCQLKPLGSHTASDRTAKTSGDIEILESEGNLFEAVEIKHGKAIDLQMIRIAKDKIYQFNPQRYCIYSSAEVKAGEEDAIDEEIKNIAKTHGCQIIINGILPTLKYYLRLVMSLEKFVNEYSTLVEEDLELKAIHKSKWNELINQIL